VIRAQLLRLHSFFVFLFALSLLCLDGCGSGSQAGGSSQLSRTNPQQLWVADSENNRVLLFNAPFTTGQNASVVLGQSDFTSSSQATSATGLNDPTHVVADAHGNLWVSDWGNNRVLQYKQPFSSGMAASLVLGQTNFTANASSTSASGLSSQHELAFDNNGDLWVADSYNNRVLEFVPPFSNGMSASVVMGQPSFTANDCLTTATGLCYPTGLAFDKNGNLWVVDSDNNRVLQYYAPFVNGESASTVLGQPSFTTAVQGAGATGVDVPWSVAIDPAGDVWVSDGGDWRVLEFTAPFSSGEAASLVLGFPNFTTTVNNNLQSSLTNPRGIAFDAGGNLYVADNSSSRVMVFPTPFSNGMNASEVIGQPDFDSVLKSTTASGLAEPVGVSISFGEN
jgi:sugar lactone lactonase YvrE